MAASYLCVHCDHRFSHDDSGKLRCPKCLRKGGLEKVAAGTAADRPAWILPALVAAALAVVGGGYAYWSMTTPKTVEGKAPLEVLDESTLEAYLRNAKVEQEDLSRLLTPTEAVEQFAEEVAGEATLVDAKVKAVIAAIRGHAAKHAFVTWSMHAPEPVALRSVDQTLEVVTTAGGRARLYPLELAVLATTALRAQGIAAMVADAWAFPGDRQPPDPSGQIGYFIVAAYADEVGVGEPILADPYGGRATVPKAGDFRVLSDAEVVAAALSTEALRLLVREHDSKASLETIEKALQLDGRAPYIRGVRAAVVLASGGVAEGIEELVSAAQIRSDAPRHHNLARIHLIQRDLSRASIEVASALELHPDFAAAHATLATIHLEEQEVDRAREELEAAERFDPEYHLLPILWAGYHLQQGNVEEAARRAHDAIRLRDYDPQTRLQAAQIFRAAGDYGAMREQARMVLEQTPEANRVALREQLLAVLGPTVFDEDLPEAAEVDGFELPSAEFDLSAGQGTGAPGLGELELGEPGGGLTLGGPSPGGDLRLGDPSSDFGKPNMGLSLDPEP